MPLAAAVVRDHALQYPEWKQLEMHFELWISGKLSDEAAAQIADAQKRISPNKYIVHYRSGDDINGLAKELNDETLKRVIQKHFLEHPFSSDVFLETPPISYVPFNSGMPPTPDAATSADVKPLQIEHAAASDKDIAQ